MDIHALITPEFRREMAATAKRDAIEARRDRELRYARQHRIAGNRWLADAYLDCAADARGELAELHKAQLGARLLGLSEQSPIEGE